MGLKCILIIILLILLVFWHREILVLRNVRRMSVYNQAKQRATQLGKPLIVVGDPASGGWVTRMNPFKYGCGDVCIDIQGCDACPATSINVDIEKLLPTLPPNSCVMFISVVLEYVSDINAVIEQLQRVCGNNLFVVYIKDQPYRASYTDKGIHFIQKQEILGAPPEQDGISYRTIV